MSETGARPRCPTCNCALVESKDSSGMRFMPRTHTIPQECIKALSMKLEQECILRKELEEAFDKKFPDWRMGL